MGTGLDIRPGMGTTDRSAVTMAAQKKKPLMRLLGEFVGHIAHGVKAEPGGGGVGGVGGGGGGVKREVKREVSEETRETAQGKVVLRRTTIEEIELRPPTG